MKLARYITHPCHRIPVTRLLMCLCLACISIFTLSPLAVSCQALFSNSRM
jgi:hypothetical protein